MSAPVSRKRNRDDDDNNGTTAMDTGTQRSMTHFLTRKAPRHAHDDVAMASGGGSSSGAAAANDETPQVWALLAQREGLGHVQLEWSRCPNAYDARLHQQMVRYASMLEDDIDAVRGLLARCRTHDPQCNIQAVLDALDTFMHDNLGSAYVTLLRYYDSLLVSPGGVVTVNDESAHAVNATCVSAINMIAACRLDVASLTRMVYATVDQLDSMQRMLSVLLTRQLEPNERIDPVAAFHN